VLLVRSGSVVVEIGDVDSTRLLWRDGVGNLFHQRAHVEGEAHSGR
jgi:hypothetical protein